MAAGRLTCLIFVLLILSWVALAARGPLSKSGINIPSQGRRPPAAAAAAGPRDRLRPGPKPKPLEERKYTPRPPIKRVVRRFSREKQIEVLMFLTHHRVKMDNGSYRPPTQPEASRWFKIPQQTISRWVRNKDGILEKKKGSYRVDNARWTCEWPEMERELFKAFLVQREKGRLVRRGWFRRTSRRLFRQLYSADNENIFVFSTGSFMGFQRRWGISCRALTKRASRLPEEYRRLVINWLRFNRRHSQPLPPLWCILNIDETPIPFEYLEGKTYDLTGSRTISAETDRSGWDKRQATLVLYLFPDGVGTRIKPKLIFHGASGDRNRILNKEQHRYHKGVTVEFNPTAYNTEELFLKFIDEELLPALASGSERQKSLLLLDVFAGHTTETVLSKLHSAGIVTSLIPGGCTGLLQPLDTAVNKPFKNYLRHFTDQYIDEEEEKRGCDIDQWSVSDKRVMTTQVVARAWEAFCRDNQEMIKKAFRDVGVTLAVDGSEDHLLKIKGFAAEDLAKEITLEQCADDLPEPGANAFKETYRELPIPGEDDFCLEYTWQLEGFAGFPGTDEDSLDPAVEEELTLSLEATAQAVEQHGMDEGGTVVDLYKSTNPDWSLYEPTYDMPDFEWLLPLDAENLGPGDMQEQLPAPPLPPPPPKGGTLIQFDSK
jgi:hypothetical protein